MKSSKEALRTARQLIEASMVDGKLDLQKVRTIVAKLVEKKPRGYVQVADQLGRLARLEVEKNMARVESAIALDEATKATVLNDLRAKYGSQIEAEYSVDPDLIGGMRIRIGSDVWDGSVKNRIERLEQLFS